MHCHENTILKCVSLLFLIEIIHSMVQFLMKVKNNRRTADKNDNNTSLLHALLKLKVFAFFSALENFTVT
jgi:hypothetical protein